MTMDKRKSRTYFFMILPAFIGFIILFIVPVIMSFGYSVTNWSVYNADIEFIGLRNFQKLFSDVKTVSAIGHSVKYAILITIIQNVLSIILAVLLNKKTKAANFVKSITFLPAVLSIMVVGYLFQYIMTSADGGLLNSIIQFFGGQPVNWLGDSNIALYSVLATQVWQWTGWSMVIYVANLKSIDSSLYEAAEIDGANGIQKFFRVTLPLLYPATSFNVLMSLIREGFNTGKTAYACAFAVVFFVLVFVFSKVVTYFLNKWEGAIQA